MKKAVTVLIAVIIGLVFTVSSGMAEDPKYSGFLGEYYRYLQPGPEGGAKMRWLKPGVDFGKYNRIMLESVIFFIADDSQYKGIDANELKSLADDFDLAILNGVKDKYPITGEPGQDVVRLRIAITHLKPNRSGLSAVSSIVPAGIGISFLKKGVGGSWTGAGATGMEFMAFDSLTNEVIALAVDDRTAGYTERFTKWGSAQEAFTFWAGRLRVFMDKAKEQKK